MVRFCPKLRNEKLSDSNRPMTEMLYSTSNVTVVSDFLSISYASDSGTLVASAPLISRTRSPTLSLPSLHTYHNSPVKPSHGNVEQGHVAGIIT